MRELQAAAAVLLAVASKAVSVPSWSGRCAANTALLRAYAAQAGGGSEPGPAQQALLSSHSYLSQLVYRAMARFWPENCFLKLLFSTLLHLAAVSYFIGAFLGGGAGFTASLPYYGRRKAARVTARVLQLYLCLAASPLSREVLDFFDLMCSLKFALYLLDLNLLLSFHFIVASLLSTLLLLLDSEFLPLAFVHAWVCLGYVLSGALGGGRVRVRRSASRRQPDASAGRSRRRKGARPPPPGRRARSKHRASLPLTAFVRLLCIALLQIWVLLLTLAPWLVSCTADGRLRETLALFSAHLRGTLERFVGKLQGQQVGQYEGQQTAGIWAVLRDAERLRGAESPAPLRPVEPSLPMSQLLREAVRRLLSEGHVVYWSLSTPAVICLFILPNVIRDLVEYDFLFRYYFPLTIAYHFIGFYLSSPFSTTAQLYYGVLAVFVALMCRLQSSLSEDDGRGLFSQFSADPSLLRPKRLPTRSTHVCVPVLERIPGLTDDDGAGRRGEAATSPFLHRASSGRRLGPRELERGGFSSPLGVGGVAGASQTTPAASALSEPLTLSDASRAPSSSEGTPRARGPAFPFCSMEFNNLHEIYRVGPGTRILRSLRGAERTKLGDTLREGRTGLEKRGGAAELDSRGLPRSLGVQVARQGSLEPPVCLSGGGASAATPRAASEPPPSLAAQLVSGDENELAPSVGSQSTSDESFTSQDDFDLGLWLGAAWGRALRGVFSALVYAKDSARLLVGSLSQPDTIISTAACLALVASCCSLGLSNGAGPSVAPAASVSGLSSLSGRSGLSGLSDLFSPSPLAGPEALPWVLLDLGSLSFAYVSLLIASRDRPVLSLARSVAAVLFCFRLVYLAEGLLSFDLARAKLWNSVACTFALHVVQTLLVLALVASKQDGA